MLSPKASERKNPPKAVVSDAYNLKEHGIRELFDGPLNDEYHFDMEEEVAWLGAGTGWLASGFIANKAGEHVAFFERWYHQDEQGKLVATHETLKVEEPHQGKGIAQAFNNHLMDWYQKVGVDRIELVAGLEVGPYAWARQGYRIQGVEGGENRKRWVSDRLAKVRRHVTDYSPVSNASYEARTQLERETVALLNASNKGEDVQPIHVASLGQNIPEMHWQDDTFGDMWPGKAVLVESDRYMEDRSREYDGVYYLGS